MPKEPPFHEKGRTYRDVAAEGMEDADQSRVTWKKRDNQDRTSGRRWERKDREFYDRTSGGNTFYDIHMTEKPTTMSGRQQNNELTRFNNKLGETLKRINDGEKVELLPTEEGRNKEQQKTISKKLSAVLRHNTGGLTVYKDGSLELSPLLNSLQSWQRQFLMSDDNLLYLVQSSDKQRFQLTFATYEENAGQYTVFLRAVQGHSGNVGRMIDNFKAMEKLTEHTCPVFCVHATASGNFESIRKNGMIPGGLKGKDNRSHVHFASEFKAGQGATLPGVRADANDWWFLSLGIFIRDGNEAYKAANDVICIPTTIPYNYFSHVVDVNKNRDRKTGERPEDYLVWFIKGTKDSYRSGKRSQPYDRQASSSSTGKTWKPKFSPLPELDEQDEEEGSFHSTRSQSECEDDNPQERKSKKSEEELVEEKEVDKDLIEELKKETDETKTPEEPETSPKQEYTLVLTENTDNREEQGEEPDWGDAESSSSSAESIVLLDGFSVDTLVDKVEKAKMLEEYKKNKSTGAFLISEEKRQEGWFLADNGTLSRLSARDRKHGWHVNEYFVPEPTDPEDKSPDFMRDFEQWFTEQLEDKTETPMNLYDHHVHGPWNQPEKDMNDLYPRKPQKAIQHAGSVLSTASASTDPARVGVQLPPDERQTGPQGQYPIQRNTILHEINMESLKEWDQVYAWLNYSKKSLPTYNEKNRKLAEQNEMFQNSKKQLNIAFFNLGNISRVTRLPAVTGGSLKEPKDNLRLTLWGDSSNHVILTAESSGLQQEDIAIYVKNTLGMTGAHSCCRDHKDELCDDLSCYVRGDNTARVVLLQEQYDDGTPRGEWIFHGAIFQVFFGKDNTPEGLISADDDAENPNPQERRNRTMCSRSTYQFGVYHINSKKCGQMDIVRKHFEQFIHSCVKHRVDVLGGDGNRAAYRYFNNQKFSDPMNSSVCRIIRHVQEQWNTGKPVALRMTLDEISSGKLDNSLAFTCDDCCWIHVFGWGKTVASKAERLAMLENKKPARHNFSSDEEYKMASQEWEDTFSQKANPRVTPHEWHVTDCERVKHITNEDLWLRKDDGDSHNPIIVRLKQFSEKNQRDRNPERTRERKEKYDATRKKKSVKSENAWRDPKPQERSSFSWKDNKWSTSHSSVWREKKTEDDDSKWEEKPTWKDDEDMDNDQGTWSTFWSDKKPEKQWKEKNPTTEWKDKSTTWTEPTWTEPTWTEPAWTEPAWTESTWTEPTWTEPTWSESAWSEPEPKRSRTSGTSSNSLWQKSTWAAVAANQWGQARGESGIHEEETYPWMYILIAVSILIASILAWMIIDSLEPLVMKTVRSVMTWTQSKQPLRSHSWTQTNRDLYYVREAEKNTQTEEHFHNNMNNVHKPARICGSCGIRNPIHYACFLKRCTTTVCPNCMNVYGSRILCLNCREEVYELFNDHLPDYSEPHWYEHGRSSTMHD